MRRALVFALLVGCKGAAGPNVTGATAASRQSSSTTEEEAPPRVCSRDAKDPAPCFEECQREIVSSCALLAARLERDGDGSAAIAHHEHACELRDPASCAAAARIYAAGRGVPPSRARQVELLARACKLGDSASCLVPAKAYALGDGVDKDEARARELYEIACAAGSERACGAIGEDTAR